MGGGYHSRSPEEFRKFLEESRKQSGGGRFSRVRLIFILNLVLVVLVIGMVARTMNPSAFTIQSSSSKVRMEASTLYIKSSRDGKDGFPTFFLFMKNETETEIRFPDPTWKFTIFLSGKEGLNCIDAIWEVPERTIHPGKIEFARFRASDVTIDSLPPDCKIKSSENFWERIFRRTGGKSGLKLEVTVSHKEDKQILSIENL
ncbi:hypothetical protein LFX25_06375 [Leptospira sp. FAT2]|uniref:hypothetical protein n=1 Tax=Leptospira sanjuanensis TaxID=2879643 RepID=UPI001EE885B0|nr:hypothetical protein [Leptospira sanjuanensis]MCG6167439.1 hypothetical protein [Leptospira sanjuanensis]MCG6192866.1 hypothetical protein [Leptospira sanjuanensis]